MVFAKINFLVSSIMLFMANKKSLIDDIMTPFLLKK